MRKWIKEARFDKRTKQIPTQNFLECPVYHSYFPSDALSNMTQTWHHTHDTILCGHRVHKFLAVIPGATVHETFELGWKNLGSPV